MSDITTKARRVAELMQAIDAQLETSHISAEWDINEILGAHDGAMMALREMWEELKSLLLSGADQMLQ